MSVVTASDARTNLYGLVAQVNEDVDTVTITSKHGNAVLVSEGEWEAIKETLFVGAQPGNAHIPAALERLRQGNLAGFTEQTLVEPGDIA